MALLSLDLGAPDLHQRASGSFWLVQRRRPIAKCAFQQSVAPTILRLRQATAAPVFHMARPEFAIVFHLVPPVGWTMLYPTPRQQVGFATRLRGSQVP